MARSGNPNPVGKRPKGTHGPGAGPARGAGYGGAAHGLRAPITADTQPAPEAKSAGHAEARLAREVAAASAVEMALLLRTIALDVTTPPQTRVDAANKLIERAEGKPTASVDLTSGGNVLGSAVDRPPRETREEWIARRDREIRNTAILGTPAGSAD